MTGCRRKRPVVVCSWCALYEWRLVELALTIVRVNQGEWRHWYCPACHSRGWVDVA